MSEEFQNKNRLTKVDGNYCEDICGMAKSCKRLVEGATRCKNALFYERLQQYENVIEKCERNN